MLSKTYGNWLLNWPSIGVSTESILSSMSEGERAVESTGTQSASDVERRWRGFSRNTVVRQSTCSAADAKFGGQEQGAHTRVERKQTGAEWGRRDPHHWAAISKFGSIASPLYQLYEATLTRRMKAWYSSSRYDYEGSITVDCKVR